MHSATDQTGAIVGEEWVIENNIFGSWSLGYLLPRRLYVYV